MKNKIIVSLLLIFLIAISLSAVSANEDLSDDITETTDSISDVELSEEAYSNTVDENNDEGNLATDNTKSDTDKLGDGGVNTGGNVIKNVTNNQLKPFLEDTGSTHYSEGSVFLLKNDSFTITDTINIKKSYTIDGSSGARINIAENVDNLFRVNSPANGGPRSVTIRNVIFIPTKEGQTILLANGVTQGINQIVNIAGITLENITIQNMGINPSVTLLNIESDKIKTETSNAINITNNQLNGARALKINGNNLTHGGLDGDEIYLPANEIIFQKNTKLFTTDIVLQYAIDKSAGDSPFDFQVVLTDENNVRLANKTINFALQENKYTAKTNQDGIATLKISISKSGTYPIYSYFEGDERYTGTSMVANSINVVKKDSMLILKNVSYKSTAKTKKLTATFKVPVYDFVLEGDVIKQKIKSYQYIKNKKVTFTVNGKTYSATTNSKGVATVKISLNKKGKYTYKAKFAGDSTYNKVTKSAKLTIKPVATSLTAKKYTYKKAAKTKKLKATLKSGTKVLKNKKVTFKVNGKTYSAKTNSKGIVTVKVKLSKKGTYKYTAKFAGDNMYKATSKSNKLIIK